MSNGNDNAEFFRISFPTASAADLNETFLSAQLSSSNRYRARAAAVLLRRCGTPAVVDSLQACCFRPIRDLQVTAIFALQAIGGADAAPFAAALLNDRRYREKWAAMIVACETGDAALRQVIEARVKQTVSRRRACPEVGGLSGKTTEIMAFLGYLERTEQKLGPLGGYLLGKPANLTAQELAAVNHVVASEQPAK